jgi:hypothetical protein
VFWDVHNPENTVVIEPKDERYNELIVEVADPQAAVELVKGGAGLKRDAIRPRPVNPPMPALAAALRHRPLPEKGYLVYEAT